MKNILLKCVLVTSLCFGITGCDLNVNTSSDNNSNKFGIVKLDKKDYLLNKKNGDLYLVKENSKELIITKEYKDKILSNESEIGPTKFSIKSKFLSKEKKLIGEMKLIYKKENKNTSVDMETWRTMLQNGNYRITLYFVDNDGFTISKKEVFLDKNHKYNSFDGYTIDISGYLNLFADLEIIKISFSYVLPEYKNLNKKYLEKDGKLLTNTCNVLKKELDELSDKIYKIDFDKDLTITPQKKYAEEMLLNINSLSQSDAKCVKDINFNQNILGKTNYLDKANNALAEIKKINITKKQ